MYTRKIASIAIAAGLSLGGAAIANATQAENPQIPEIEWDTSLVKFQFDSDKFIGQRFSATCPELTLGKLDESTVYGTDAYPSDNALCVAALHAGQIDENGGTFTVQLNPGAESYVGTARNGVTTASLPATERSFVFIDETTFAAANEIREQYIPRLKWDTKFTKTGFAYKQMLGQRFTFKCPAAPNNLRPRRVVGTDSYDFKAIVCRAAVHAGALTLEGGFVDVQMDPGNKKLVGSIRNGIETKNGPSGIRSISFVDSPV
ncbi:MAG: LCCL domain-containing protein [Pseudomonadota bacterium]